MTRVPANGPALLRLSLAEFRSYAGLELGLDGRAVVLTGPNGAGKTNLLEAVSFLSPGRGLRRAGMAEVARQGGSGAWAVAARLRRPHEPEPLALGTGRQLDQGNKRVVRIDGQAARSQQALADHLAVAWLTPVQDRLFIEGASARRRFLDRLVYGLDAGHAGRLASYEHAMRERLKVLRDGRRDPAWLNALEDTMARDGVAVAAARRETVAQLAAAVELGIGPFPAADLALDGTLECALADQPALAVEDQFRAALTSNRRLDGETGTTQHGPHRGDLRVRHRARAMAAEHCSTGEQKALLIALVLANARLIRARHGAAPLLLLDELAAHLDRIRRAALFDEVLALGGQAWMTGTDAELFAPLQGRAQFFMVEDGQVRPA